MYYSKGYASRYGGGYHNYSMVNRTNTNRSGMSSNGNPTGEHAGTGCSLYSCKGTGAADTFCLNSASIDNLSLAMGYVPWQTWGNLYSEAEALRNGTIFRELDLKFCG